MSINIEKVFIELQRAWHPPSSATREAFTRHSRALSELFERLRGDDGLTFLDEEIYKDLPSSLAHPAAPPQAIDEPAGDATPPFRKAFYLCGALVQLMEDVYLDLDLETEHRHPDNLGWMHLFRHWALSDTFRTTWALTASTFGVRFQDFCRRKLNLPIGRATIKTVGFWEPNDPGEEPLLLPLLNRYETRLLATLRQRSARGKRNRLQPRMWHVVAGRLVVPSAEAAESLALGPDHEGKGDLLDFTFGFAVVSQEGELAMVRVRENFRYLGLGRLLIESLVQRLGVSGLNLPEPEDLGALGLPRRSPRRVIDIYRSVLNEEAIRRDRRRNLGDLAKSAHVEYTGVIRPTDATWAHALGFLYWVMADADETIDERERKVLRSQIIDWLDDHHTEKEARRLEIAGRQWFEDAKKHRLKEEETDALLRAMQHQSWFEGVSSRFRDGLLCIAYADRADRFLKAALSRNYELTPEGLLFKKIAEAFGWRLDS